MGAGFDKYYQIARCFRDEDLRGDRQPEFTQIDLETSFMDEEGVQEVTEGLLAKVMKDVKGIDLQLPLPRITWQESMDKYGCDKPDTRYEMLIHVLAMFLPSLASGLCFCPGKRRLCPRDRG